MVRDPCDSSPGNTPANKSAVDERNIPVGAQLPTSFVLRPNSAVGGLNVNNPASSGSVICPDFRSAPMLESLEHLERTGPSVVHCCPTVRFKGCALHTSVRQ